MCPSPYSYATGIQRCRCWWACYAIIVDAGLIVVTGHRTMLLKNHILHRDISLGNIMYDGDGGEGNTGRLIDFDLAKHVAAGDPMVRTPRDFQTVRFILAWSGMGGLLIYCRQ